MSCSRCGGFLVDDELVGGEIHVSCLRCYNCGDYSDWTISYNRRLPALPDPGGQARTSVYDPDRVLYWQPR